MDRPGHEKVKYFVGTEVEHTPAFGMTTLFVVGLQPIDEIESWLSKVTLKNIKHIFFNSEYPCNNQYDWGTTYINETYKNKIEDAKIETVSPNSKHFGKNGHSLWNRFLLNHIITNNFI